MTDTPSTPSDDTRPFGTPETEPQATQEPAAASTGHQAQQADAPRIGPPAGQPGPPPWPYAGPYGVSQYPGQPAYPGYPPPPQRPRFSDQVLGMRAVIAVALVALVIGGLGGALLGALAGGNDDARVSGPGGLQPGGTFGQMPNQGRLPQQQFGQSQP